MSTCPSTHELSRAISDGADLAIEAHLASCATCAAEWAATVNVIALAREVSAPLPSAARREEVRTMTLAANRTIDALGEPPRRARRWYLGAAAVMVAAAVVSIVVLASPTSATSPHAHATVRPLDGARYVASSMTPDEVIGLFDGSIDVEVAPLHRGERFRVLLTDSEIEVHGTRFVATARAGKLVRVDVMHGLVEVRYGTSESQFLRADETWNIPATQDTTTKIGTAPIVAEVPPAAPVPVATDGPPPTSSKAKSQKSAATLKPAAPIEAPQERAYRDGWASMRASRFSEAAKAFLRVQLLEPDGPLAEDASYWYAVALARAEQDTPASDAFRDFLDRYPRSQRMGEASAMLGWLLVTTGELAEATRRFRAAIDDPNPAVRKSAQAGLDAATKSK